MCTLITLTEISWNNMNVLFWLNVACCAKFAVVLALGDLEVGFISTSPRLMQCT